MRRLAARDGEWIDRSRELGFSFEGRAYRAFAGDTVSSALAASGVRTLGRSFKYHRARGLLSAANHDVNAMVQDGATPNLRADVTPVRDGAAYVAVNTFGGLARDRGRWIEGLAALLPVGFYYKAFHSRRLFPFWERMFRRVAGLGALDPAAPRRHTPKRYDFCDVLVVGAGPSGLAAALAAADAGAAVLLVDENTRPGGSGAWVGAERARTAALLEQVHRHPRVRLICDAFACGYYADHWVPLVTHECVVKVRARAVVIAMGAMEQPAVFRNNDLPGVMLASGGQRLLARYAVAPCSRAVLLAANAQGYAAAADLLDAGIAVAAVVDLRAAHEIPATVREDMLARGVRLLAAHGVHEAHAGPDGAVCAVSVAPLRSDGGIDATRPERIGCDGLLTSVGWAPAAQLLYQAGMRVRFDHGIGQFVPAALPEGVFACGRVNGLYALEHRLQDGARAGAAAAAAVGAGEAALGAVRTAPDAKLQDAARTSGAVRAPFDPEAARRVEPRASHPYPIFAHPAKRNFVDFDEDLQLDDFVHAAQEGFDNIELLKRFSTVGMGPSQGKHSNMNAVRILARLRREPIEALGTTTARPMFHPVPLAHLAGRAFHAERRTPLHAWHAAAGARWMSAGVWWRPEYYALEARTRRECIEAEALAVRQAVGLIDVGTLGKIEVSGPDATEFVERVYTGRFAKLAVGMTRYGLMLDESGVVIDDGVIARMSPRRFYFTTTTGNSASIYRELNRLNALWGLRVGIVNLTGQLAAMNLAGPRSRQVLQALTDIALDDESFPYLGVREAEVAGVAARLLRVGFVGELGYEIHVAADGALHVWKALVEAGRGHGLQPFGVEAQRLLRLEKGHVIIGQDTDGLTDPLQLGMDWAVRMDKPFFVGQRSLRIIAQRAPSLKLTGFTLADAQAPLPRECHLVIEAGEIAGRVTSVARSPTLGRVIGLALVRPALAERGHFRIRVEGGTMVEARVAATPFYDAGNRRQRQSSGAAPPAASRHAA